MSLYRGSKLFSNGSLLLIFFYILLGIFTYGLSFSVFGGWDPSFILYVPIIIGIAGMGTASLNFSKEKEFTWERGKQVALFIFLGSGILFLSILLLILVEWVDYDVIVYIGDVGLILSCIAYAVGFFFLQRQLAFLYLKRVIVRYPKYYATIGFGVQAFAYAVFFINWFFTENAIITATLVIIGIVFAAISIILIAMGFIQINIAFRAYPHLVENEELRPV
ncbi:MAG: hypothetical protein KGD64_02515 [Candidatus Heimdallarchaeota archaeon]|nr:hypothetical protein [Candidatus Heimdallarchaeota archaeon]